jgi:hypothetical protein
MAMTSSGYSLQVGVRVDTTTIATQLDSFAKGYTLRINAEVNGQQGLNNLVSSVSLVNQQVQTLNGNLNHMGNQLSTNLDNATRSATNFSTRTTNGLRQVSRQAQNTGKSLSQVIIDQARTRLVTEAITLMIQGFGEAINIVKEFDDALTDFKKVSDLSGESLDNYTKKLGELGETVSRTRTEMIQSAEQFVKSGYSEQDSAELAQVAELYRNIADAELTSAESASFIISQMKAYGNETEEFSYHVIDAVYI